MRKFAVGLVFAGFVAIVFYAITSIVPLTIQFHGVAPESIRAGIAGILAFGGLVSIIWARDLIWSLQAAYTFSPALLIFGIKVLPTVNEHGFASINYYTNPWMQVIYALFGWLVVLTVGMIMGRIFFRTRT